MAIKSDDIWETIRHIDTVLPRRRVLLLTRDFRDNLLSVSNKDFGPVEPIVAARYVKERFAYYHEEYSRTEPAHRLHVRYEDILESPDRFVSDFGAHFGLTHEDEDRAGPIDPGRIRRDNVRKWTRLSPTELAQCEAILREEMLTYGYSPEREAVPPPEGAAWALARARDAARRVPQKLRSIAKRLSR
jgi:hypothetical protein